MGYTRWKNDFKMFLMMHGLSHLLDEPTEKEISKPKRMKKRAELESMLIGTLYFKMSESYKNTIFKIKTVRGVLAELDKMLLQSSELKHLV